jgi:[protein-PII] uridylyltransferase
VAYVSAGKKAKADAKTGLTSLGDAAAKLRASPSVLNQFEIRLRVDELARRCSPQETGEVLKKAIYGDASDAYFISLYRSRLLEVLIPDLRKLRGLVQHDHYHRFTADAHVMQALREVQRAKSVKTSLDVMSRLTKDLTPQEWWTLKLTALFHDLAKGRKGDHSSEGATLVKRYFKEWGYPDGLRDEVHWLVENHLILSTAAFRQNPQAQSTWRRLFDRGVEGRRMVLLALFTAIDIRATNPEAWTKWKAQLLLDLVESLRSPEARSLSKHLDYAEKNAIHGVEDWLVHLDPLLLVTLPPSLLIKDLQAAGRSSTDLPPNVWRVKNGRVWVRFHRRQDETGLFLDFVKRLFGLSLSIQMSSVSTLEGIGVYDWFCLRTEKSVRQISTWLGLAAVNEVKIPSVEFQSIDLMSQDEDEWIISFRGRDQRGLLLSAANALVEEKLSLKWARAHTWGQQIDDIFSIQPLGEVEDALNRLRKRFVT